MDAVLKLRHVNKDNYPYSVLKLSHVSKDNYPYSSIAISSLMIESQTYCNGENDCLNMSLQSMHVCICVSL